MDGCAGAESCGGGISPIIDIKEKVNCAAPWNFHSQLSKVAFTTSRICPSRKSRTHARTQFTSHVSSNTITFLVSVIPSYFVPLGMLASSISLFDLYIFLTVRQVCRFP